MSKPEVSTLNWPFEAAPAHFTAKLWESGELGDTPCGCTFWRVCQDRRDMDARVSRSLAPRSIVGLFAGCERPVTGCVPLMDLAPSAIKEMRARANTRLRCAHFLIAACLAGCSRIREIFSRAALPLSGVVHDLRGRTGRRWSHEDMIWTPLAPRISEYDLPDGVRNHDRVQRFITTFSLMPDEDYQQFPLIQTSLGYACGDIERARAMIIDQLVSLSRRSNGDE